MEKPERNITKKRNEQIAMSEAVAKRERLGTFSLTAQDHRDLRGTPNKFLVGKNEGKAQHEVMTDEEIEQELDEAIEYMNDENLGYILKKKVKTDIPFLRSVGRLPEKYKNFDTNKL